MNINLKVNINLRYRFMLDGYDVVMKLEKFDVTGVS